MRNVLSFALLKVNYNLTFIFKRNSGKQPMNGTVSFWENINMKYKLILIIEAKFYL